MHIDLLVTPKGEVGLVSDQSFDSEPSGAIYDAHEQSLTLEFAETFDSFVMNVPLADEYAEHLMRNNFVHFGVFEKGKVTTAKQLPLMLLNVVWE